MTMTSDSHTQPDRSVEPDEFVHTGPGTLAGRYLRRSWQPVYVAEKLPQGRIVPIRILGEDLALYRGESGTARIISNECPHRLTRLHIGWIEGETIRCRYHGWRFDESGQCVEQPAEPKPFCDRVRKLASYPTHEAHGLIFAYLGEGAPPSFRPLPGLEDGVREGWTVSAVGRNDPVQLVSERGEHHGRRPCEFRASRSPGEHGGAAVRADEDLGPGNPVRAHAIPGARRANR